MSNQFVSPNQMQFKRNDYEKIATPHIFSSKGFATPRTVIENKSDFLANNENQMKFTPLGNTGFFTKSPNDINLYSNYTQDNKGLGVNPNTLFSMPQMSPNIEKLVTPKAAQNLPNNINININNYNIGVLNSQNDNMNSGFCNFDYKNTPSESHNPNLVNYNRLIHSINRTFLNEEKKDCSKLLRKRGKIELPSSELENTKY